MDVPPADAAADLKRPPAPAITQEGEPKDAADNAESLDFFENTDAIEEKGSVSAAATTGESGTFQPAGQSAIKQVIPEPDPTTGALIYSYPLTVPPGRNGLTPDLKLTYNSQESRKGSYLGDRWSLNIPYIERLNKTGTDRLYTETFFTSSLGGELVPVSGTAYAPQVENGDFLKYRYDGTSWTMTDKRGTVYTFGAQTSARQDDPSDATKVYRWMLEEVRDTNGNFIDYAYYKDEGQIYPDTVTYTGNGVMSGIFKVTFARGAYDDMSPSLYYPNFKVKTGYQVTSITMTVSGEWVRKYDLGYTAGDSGYRVMLASITESGRDLDTNAVTVLPAATFAYKTRGPLGWDQVTNWQMPYWFVDRAGESTMIQIADVNGDTYPDVSYNERNQGEAVYLNNTLEGWNANDVNWPFPIWIKNTTGFKDNGTRIFDVNGDLLADVVRSFSTSSGDPSPAASSVYLNSGDPATGWVPTSSIAVPVGFVFGGSLYADDAVRITDVNGDGLADLVRAYLDDDSPGGLLNQSVYLGTGSGWTAAAPGTWQVPFPIIDENPYNGEVYTFAQFVDINGDNLPDILWRYSDADGYWWPSSSSSSNRTFINNGHGWDLIEMQVPVPFESDKYINYGNSDNGARASDLNGDGIPDILWSAYPNAFSTDSNAYLHSGAETTYPYTLLNSINAPEQFARAGKQTNTKVQLADVNADGLDDFVYSERNRDGVFLTRTHLGRPNSFTDLLTSVTAPTGGTYAVTYKLSNQYRNGDNSLMSPKLPFAIPTVERITATDPVTGVSGTSTWSYKDGSYYYFSPTDRRFAGFGTITKTDPAGNATKTYYHQGNASNTSQGEYTDHASKIGKPYRVEQYDASGNLYAVTVNKWDRYSLGADRDFVKLVGVTALTYDGNGTHRDTAAEYAYDDTYGNLTQKTEWGEVTASADGSFADTGADKSTENISYALNTSNYVVGLPYQDTVLDQSSNKIRETNTYYDNLALGSVGAGNPTRSERWKDGANYVSSEKSYNTTYGLVTSETDPRGKVTSYAYDSYNLYPATITDPLTHAAQYLYDYSSGKAKQITDQNGFVYQTAYDGLDRVKEERIPDSSPPYSPVTRTAYAYTDTANAFKVQRSEYLDGATAAEVYQYLDGFGRLIQERKEAEAAGSFNVKDTVYNVRGLVEKQSLPYPGSGSARTAPTGASSLYATYAYDALGRPFTITDALGTTTYTYDDWKTTVTDKNGKVKRYYKDAYGNLAKVDEVNGGSTYVTTYDWNLNGRLIKLTDALGNIRNFTYDGLGRRLTAEDLHAPADASFGTWTYAYDAAGNLLESVSPESRTLELAYDDLNRVLTEDYTGAAGIEIGYTYDSCTKGIGKLCTVTMTSGANAAYAYDVNGKIASETKTINGTAYATSYTYDRQGNTLTLTYPDGAQVRYTFNTAGLLNQVEARESGGAFANVVSNIDYSPLDEPATIAYANGVTTTNTYDPAKLYRLAKIRTVAPGSGGGQAPPTTSTFYPDPGTGGPTGSATVERYTALSGETWSTLRAGAGTYVSPIADNPNNLAGAQSGTTANQWRALDRAIFTFDTSTIPDSDIISSATLSIYGSAKSDGGTAIAPDINIYDATPATNYNFAAATYGQIGSIPQATAISYAGWSTTGYNDFILNAAGLGNISKTGITKFGTRNANYDVANIAPAWSSNTGHFITGYLAQEVGTSKDPKLVVIHAPASPPDLAIQDLNFTYDAVGNIAQLIDASTTSAAKTVTYGYDDLHRLTSAVATNAANSANYTQTYAYDALGNIISGPLGGYFYQGNSGTNWANPHAVTSIGGTVYVYDKDGNLITNGTRTNTWNYKGQLAQVAMPSSASNYYYDHGGNRVRVTVGSTNTYYPNKFYNTDGAKKTKQVYTGSRLVATIETMGSAVNMYYVHADHLGSTSAVSDSASALAQTLDYLPFGAQRISSGTYNEQRQYIGEVYDADTGLNYLNARYYWAGIGRFISQDPSFLDIGTSGFEQKYQRTLQQHLMNPQALNSYSYGLNNPITNKDPEGEILPLLVAGWAAVELGLSAYDAYTAYQTVNDPSATDLEKSVAIGGFAAGLVAPGGGYGSAGKGLIGQSFGKLGTVIENTPGKVTGYIDHAIMRMQERNISDKMINSIVNSAEVTLKQSGGTILYLTRQGGVVLNKVGEVVTAYSKNEFKPQIKDILNRARPKK